MSTTGVNVNAGKKAAPRKWFWSKSPDLAGQTQQPKLIKSTVGEILNDEDTENQMVVQNISNSGMKLKIRGKTPVRPSYNEMTATTFEVILIMGTIAKCTGCRGKLKDGPKKVLDNVDRVLYMSQRKRPFFFATYSYWKPTFSNIHYHLLVECILG